MQKTFTLRHLFRFRNAFLNKFKIPMKKPLKKKLIITTAILMANSTFFFGKNVFFDEPKSNDNVENKLTEHQKKLQSLSKLVKYEIGLSSEVNEGQIKEFFIGENKDIPIIVMRHKNRLFALNAVCTYDGKTNLKDGILFENKLYCPIHGCAYNIVTGSPEYTPARDYLPKYFIFEKDGKMTVHAPEVALKKILPPFAQRDFNDLRKVVILGSSAAAQGCIETLKENGYTGEITVITKDSKYPYDKTRLTKEIKDLDYKSLELREDRWYRQGGINFLFGREINTIDNTHGAPSVILEDGLKIEYDALLVATGTSNEIRDFTGLMSQENFLFLRDMQDHQVLREQLKSIKKLCVIGLNFKSLETISTIRREHPEIEIILVDENKQNWIQKKFGDKLFESLLNLHLDNGVAFLLRSRIKEVVGDDKKVNKIVFYDGNVLETDAVLSFPNNNLANTKFVMESETLDNLTFDEEGRIKTNVSLRSDHKRLFAAGDCCSAFYFINNFRIPCETWNFAYHQGMIAAYNILALNIPLHMTNFAYTQQYDKVIQYIGWCPFYDEEFTEGDIEKLDFVNYYAVKDEIIAVCGNQSQNNKMLILNEAFRLNLMPSLSNIKSGKYTIQKIEEDIRNAKKSGCYKGLINKIQDDVVLSDLIWIQRDKSNEFYNYFKEGAKPEQRGLSSDSISDKDKL